MENLNSKMSSSSGLIQTVNKDDFDDTINDTD